MSETVREKLFWQDRAACRKEDPRLFDCSPNATETQDTRKAKKICGQCSVKLMCLNWAITERETYNVLGGLLPRERLTEAGLRMEVQRRTRTDII